MLCQEEARRAPAVLGVPAKDIIFLGFPNGGLCPLRMQFLADNGLDYTSPSTLWERRNKKKWQSLLRSIMVTVKGTSRL
jgi:LmbE family N-acetylglucosaminyl deacetylase